MTTQTNTRSVAVYCGSSLGRRKEYKLAALSMGYALAEANRPLVYGGGRRGLMGIVSGGALIRGGSVTGVIPHTMIAKGGEEEKSKGVSTTKDIQAALAADRRDVHVIIVDSMHTRKVEMAKRAGAFVGLPGGFGTFEEILEVATWTQIGIHKKPVIIANVLSYFDPLKQLIKNGLEDGYIAPQSANLITFVDGPSNYAQHETYDWGKAVVEVIDGWIMEDFTPSFYWGNTTDHLSRS